MRSWEFCPHKFLDDPDPGFAQIICTQVEDGRVYEWSGSGRMALLHAELFEDFWMRYKRGDMPWELEVIGYDPYRDVRIVERKGGVKSP